MKIFTFATLEEADSTLKETNAKKCADHFSIGEDLIVITGIGPFSTYTTLLPFVKKASALYNFGIAGSLHDNTGCHTIASISKLKWHPKTASYHDPIAVTNTGLRLCTLDFPLHGGKIKEELKENFDLVDMEAYAIALLAQNFGLPLTVIKVISDFCNKNTSSQIAEKISHLSTNLATELQRILNR